MATWINVSGKQIADAQAASSNALKVPAKARVNKKAENDAFWTEALTIIKAGSTTQEKDGNTITAVEIRWRCSDAGDNAGREFTDFWRINWTVYPDGDTKNGWYGISQREFGKVQAVMHASGIQADLPDGGFSAELLSRTFPDDGNSPLLNKEVAVEIRQNYDEYRGEILPRVWKVLPSTKSRASAGPRPVGMVTI